MTVSPTRSALLVIVPNAEPAVGAARQELDPAAALGVPAHITVLYPFVPPGELCTAIDVQIARLVGAHPAFDFALDRVATFPELTWLAPRPAAPLAALTHDACAQFGLEPYEGEHDEVLPHLTVGHGARSLDLALHKQLRAHLPIPARASSVELWVGGPDGWSRARRFPLRQTVAQTPRLTLRTWDPAADAAAIFGVWGNAETMRFVEGGVSESVQAVERGLCLGNRAHGDSGHCLWAVELRETGHVIGDCGFHVVDDRPGIELGFHLDPRFWNRGYATEAATAAVQYAFEVLAAPSIHAWVAPGNDSSVRVLGKLGFQERGLDDGERYFILGRPSV